MIISTNGCIGQVGLQYEFDVTLKNVFAIGGNTLVCYLLDDDGHTLKWVLRNEKPPVKIGDDFAIIATIKGFTSDELTIIHKCKVI